MARRFLSFIFGIIAGMLILVLGVGGGVYLFISKDGGMRTVQEKIEESSINETLQINLSEEQQEMSLLNYGKGLVEAFGNLSTGKIGDLEDTIGVRALSKLISDTVGIEAEVIRESSLENIGETITNNLTLKLMTEKYGIELPDMPLFQDETFLAKPVSTAFKDLDNETLDKIVEVVYEEDATPAKPASTKLLQKLGKKTIKEVSSDMDSIVKETEIADVMTITDDSTEVLKYFRDNHTTIDGIDKAIKEMTISNAVKIDENSSAVMKYLKDKKLDELDKAIKEMKIADAIDIVTDEEVAADPTLAPASSLVLQYFKKKNATLDGIDEAIKDMTIGDAVRIDESSSKVLQYLKTAKLDELDEKVQAMTIGDAVEVTSSSHAILQKISDLTLNDLGDRAKLQARIDTVTIGEVVTINDNSEPILKALKDTTLGGLNDRIATLAVGDVFKDHDVGILSVIPEGTKIGEIADVLKTTFKEATLYSMRAMGMFEYHLSYENGTTHDAYVKKANMHNANPQNLVDSVTAMIDAVESLNISAIQNAMRSTENIKVYLREGTTTLSTEHYTYFQNKGGSNVKNISEVATKDADGYYVITPSVARSLATIGTETYYAVTFFVDAGIKIKIDDNGSNFDYLFGMDFACDDTNPNELVFTCPVSAVSDGGYAYYRCNNVKVGEDDWATFVTANGGSSELAVMRLFTVKEIYETAAKKAAGIKTRTTLIEIVTNI